MPGSIFFMYPRNDDDYGVIWGPNLKCKMAWDSWYGRLLKGIYNITAFTITTLYSMTGYYIMWVLLHYFSAHLYTMYCVPFNVYGFILSPFMSSAPHCIALRWLITEGSNVIVTMWIVIGTYAIQCILRK